MATTQTSTVDQAATDAANAAKFSTPLPPNDPASIDGARADANYIGPTNFANIQKQYTPYQIEQATTRNDKGDIFWKPGVDIGTVPSAAPVTPFQAPPIAPTPSTSNLPTGAIAPDVSVTKPVSNMDAFAQAQSQASQAYLTGIQSSIDGLLAKQQAMETAAKDAATKEVGGLKDKLLGIVNGGNQAQTALDATRAKFQVDQSIQTLTTIQGKIADATSALNQGILYEESQPVRMQLLTGRSSELKKQGIATIGALQAAAEVVKGNIDLARSYAADTINAIQQDNAEKTSALNTLLNLANNNLIQLTADEKETINRRTQLLDDQSKNIEKDKDAILNLATQYPQAFTSGGVTFTDSPDQALQKMLPTMSAQEKEQYQLDVQQKQASIASAKAAAAKKAASGSGSAVGDFDEETSKYINYLFEQNTSIDQVVRLLGGPAAISKKQHDALQDFWADKNVKGGVTENELAKIYGLDPAKHADLVGKTPEEVVAAKKAIDEADSAEPGNWDAIKGAASSAYKNISDFWNNVTS